MKIPEIRTQQEMDYVCAINRELSADVERLKREIENLKVDLGDAYISEHLTMANQKVAALKVKVERLEAALTLTRGQWIHSTNAPICLMALGKVDDEYEYCYDGCGCDE